MSSIGVGEWEVQTIGCKIGYQDVLYNMGNITNICNNWKWSVTFKNCIEIKNLKKNDDLSLNSY